MVNSFNDIIKNAVDTIHKNRFICVVGPTGSGKSSTIPVAYAKAHPEASVLVIQPRRLPCVNLAKYVAEKNNWTIGKEVGVTIGMLNNASALSRLTFATAGSIVNKIVNEPELPYDTIFFDEAHEHQPDQELLLAIFRCYALLNPKVRCIIMSATLEIEVFHEYFPKLVNVEIPCLFHAPYLITEHRWDSIVDYAIDAEKIEALQQSKNLEDYNKASCSIAEDLLKDSLLACSSAVELVFERNIGDHGSILVFLPSFEAITRMTSLLSSKDLPLDIRSLHSKYSEEHIQATVFAPAPEGLRKVILTTSIAETSLTFPDSTVVIDTGLARSRFYNEISHKFDMKDSLASVNSRQQRRGRVGRVSDGHYILLLPKSLDGFVWTAISSPLANSDAIEAQHLKRPILSIMASKFLRPDAIFNSMILPPSAKLVKNALVELRNQSLITDDFKQTLKGALQSSAPVDSTALMSVYYALAGFPRLGILLAVLANNDPFVSPLPANTELPKYHKNRDLNRLLTFIEWKKTFPSNIYSPTPEEIVYCEQNFLSYSAMRQVELTCYTFFERFSRFGLCEQPHMLERELLRRQTLDFKFENSNVPGYISTLLNVTKELPDLDSFLALHPLMMMLGSPEQTYMPSSFSRKKGKGFRLSFATRATEEKFEKLVEKYPELNLKLNAKNKKRATLEYSAETRSKVEKLMKTVPQGTMFLDDNQIYASSICYLHKNVRNAVKVFSRDAPFFNPSSLYRLDIIDITPNGSFATRKPTFLPEATFITPLFLVNILLCNNETQITVFEQDLVIKVVGFVGPKKKSSFIIRFKSSPLVTKIAKMISELSQSYALINKILCDEEPDHFIYKPTKSNLDPRKRFRAILLEFLSMSVSEAPSANMKAMDDTLISSLQQDQPTEQEIRKWNVFCSRVPVEKYE